MKNIFNLNLALATSLVRVLLMISLTTSAALAGQSVALANADFEQTNIISGQILPTEAISGWNVLRGPGSNRVSGVYWPSASAYPTQNSSNGPRVGFSWNAKFGDGFAYNLPALSPGGYRLTLALGLRSDTAANIFGGAQISIKNSVGAVLASRQVTNLGGSSGFTDFNLDANLGVCNGCRVEITSLGNGNYLDIDNLRLRTLTGAASLNQVEQWGRPLEILNSDFEESQLQPGQILTTDNVPNWTRISRSSRTGVAGLWWPSTAGYTYLVDRPYGNLTAAPIGARGPVVAFIWAPSAGEGWKHSVSELLAGKVYRINVAIGKRATSEVFSGATITVKDINGSVLASRSVNQLDGNAGFYDMGLDFVPNSNCSACSIEITSEGIGNGAGYLDIDNLRVDMLQGWSSVDTGNLTLDMPIANQIFQRNKTVSGNGYEAEIKVSGRLWYGLVVPTSKVTATLLEVNGQAVAGVTADQPLTFDPATGAFSGELLGTFNKGGNFNVAIDVKSANGATYRRIVSNIGVGDVFVIAGQSNSATFGKRQTPYVVTSPGRAADINQGRWSTMQDDVIPSISELFTWPSGSWNSAWPQFADLLSKRLDVPVGVLAIGYGGSNSQEWIPGKRYMESYFGRAIRFLDVSGYKAVLWHQGESETDKFYYPNLYPGYNIDQTITNYKSMIIGMRRKAGKDVPWHIAEASYTPTAESRYGASTVAAQLQMMALLPYVRPGSNTDMFGVRGWTHDGIHFNGLGLDMHAKQWVDTFSAGQPLSEAVINNSFSEAALGAGQISVVASTDAMNTRFALVGWPSFNAAMTGPADGVLGVWSPAAGNSTYLSGGIDGKGRSKALGAVDGAYAFMYGSSTGSMLRQTTGLRVGPNKSYKLSVNLGKRNNTETFAGLRISLMLGATEVAARNVNAADLVAGRFTSVVLNWTSSSTVPEDTRLAIKLSVIQGGERSYVDIEDVQLLAQP